MNDQIAKNLSYCYYKQNDIENTLASLKSVALSDSEAMNQFFILSVKNEIIDNIKWALRSITSKSLLKGGINHVLMKGLISKHELLEILKNNPYVDVN
jgi:hypothetical protein